MRFDGEAEIALTCVVSHRNSQKKKEKEDNC